jgi:hypothetical protein
MLITCKCTPLYKKLDCDAKCEPPYLATTPLEYMLLSLSHKVERVKKDQYKIAFVTNWGGFVWVVMAFGVKNGPPTYQRVVTKAFHEYIDVFMKIFLDDFIVFSDLPTHLDKLKKYFLKCKEYGISLNLKKCAFMVFFGTILGFIVSKKGKTLNPKKIKALIKMSVSKTP